MKSRKERKTKIKEDYGYNNLPHNRFEVFKRLITKRFPTLLKIGFFTFLFFIPLFGFNIFSNFLYRSVSINELNQEVAAQLLSVCFLRATISIPLFGIAGLGIGCLIHYCQMLVWDEIVFDSDYFSCLKNNWLKYLIIGVLLGISYGIFIFLFEYCTRILVFGFALIASIFGFAQLLFFFVFYLQIYMQIEVYKNKFSALIINSFKHSIIGFFPLTLLIIFVIYPGFNTFLNIFVLDIICVFLFVVNIAPSIIACILYTNYLFDKTINLEKYPEIYDKGVYRNIF